ncbi:hypothetical protein ACKW6Q_15740 [Chryseobacterium kwangjuense]|uniref:Uncharacterized protein n=1 Tax=Chryseobacterium kwangjuense TaxID=267125 RepID=A0ABW9K512_9FLAO
MSKKKLLIHEVFEQAERESGRDTKNGKALYLWSYFEEHFGIKITEKSFVRYYDAYIAGTDNKEINIEPERLNLLSKYVGYKDFNDFSQTYIKRNETANKTTVKIKVDEDEQSLSEKFSNLNINITNEQHFKMPEFLKQNGLGIMEIALLGCLVTGNVVFSNSKKMDLPSTFGLMSGIQSGIEKKYMYWDGERYIATDSSFIRPGLEVKAMNEHQFLHFKKIMRKDTLTDVNALGKTWYSKYNNEVEFFTDDGVDPDNGRELRRSTSLIIYKYAGKQKDSVGIEE